MPMSYSNSAISETEVPRAVQPIFQHLLDTYASETSKVISVWGQFSHAELPCARPMSITCRLMIGLKKSVRRLEGTMGGCGR